MVDPDMISAAIAAASSGIKLIDRLADQVKNFITNNSDPGVPQEHRMQIEGTETEIVSRRHGEIYQTITAKDLENLPEDQLRLIRTFEKSMQNHYAIWEATYPQLPLMVDPIAKARVEQQLNGVIGGMKGDLNGILSFLELAGLELDDHYQHIRHLVNQA